jgi:hypothetical protein
MGQCATASAERYQRSRSDCALSATLVLFQGRFHRQLHLGLPSLVFGSRRSARTRPKKQQQSARAFDRFDSIHQPRGLSPSRHSVKSRSSIENSANGSSICWPNDPLCKTCTSSSTSADFAIIFRSTTEPLDQLGRSLAAFFTYNRPSSFTAI